MASIFNLTGGIYQLAADPIPFEHNVDQFSNYIIEECICKTVQLGNSALSAIGSLLTLPITGRAIEYPWVTLKANKPASEEGPSTIYLVAQSYKDTLGLKKIESEEAADKFSKGVADREESAEHMCIHKFNPISNTTVGDVIEFMTRENKPYNAMLNNCQHFVANFSNEFGNRDDYEIIETKSRRAFVRTGDDNSNFTPEIRDDFFRDHLRDIREREHYCVGYDYDSNSNVCVVL